MKRALRSAVRSVQTVAECPRLTKFSVRAPKSVEVEFDNGSAYNLSAEYLRIYSPAVDSKIRSIGGEKTSSSFLATEIAIWDVIVVGPNLKSLLLFDDLHKTGIFTWDYFYHLGSNKFSLIRNYITTLKKHGLSRDPSWKK